MKTIFDPHTIDKLKHRIEQLHENSLPQWGKMNVYQMLVHCVLNEEMIQGKRTYKHSFVGKVFGKMTLKGILKNEAPLKKNQPTHKDFIITRQGDFQQPRQQWLYLIDAYKQLPRRNFDDFKHPFFGTMNYEQIGQYEYKHIDHHLRQFGV